MVDAHPKVSIGMPVYNAGKFLAATLESIAGQTLQDYELIISDNASTDDTEEICRSFAATDARLRYFRNVANLGVGRNFRRALEEASGRYFKWAAGDDLLLPDYLRVCVEVLDTQPEVVMCSSRMPFVDERGELVPYDAESGGFVTAYGEVLEWLPAPAGLESESPVDRFREVVQNVRGNLTAEFLYGTARKSAMDRVLPFELYLGAEKVFIAELSLKGRLHRVPQDLLYRRMHPDHHGGRPLRQISKGYDPQWSGRIAFPAARQLRGYAQTVARSSLPVSDKARCYGVLARKSLNPKSLNRLLVPGPGNYLGIGRKTNA